MKNQLNIKQLLQKHKTINIKIEGNGTFSLIKLDGRYFYSINKCVVGISEDKLDWIIEQIPNKTVQVG